MGQLHGLDGVKRPGLAEGEMPAVVQRLGQIYPVLKEVTWQQSDPHFREQKTHTWVKRNSSWEKGEGIGLANVSDLDKPPLY